MMARCLPSIMPLPQQDVEIYADSLKQSRHFQGLGRGRFIRRRFAQAFTLVDCDDFPARYGLRQVFTARYFTNQP